MGKKLRVLDLFAGLEGASAAFRERGHDITTLDLGVDGKFAVDFEMDILDVKRLEDLERGGGPFDVVWASPPCTAYSVASIGHHWTGGWRAYEPKTEAAKNALKVTGHTIWLLKDYAVRHPKVRWAIENPRGLMRKLFDPPTLTTTYCRWGDTRMKPTDLWLYNFSGDFPMCHNGNSDHAAAPRGSRTAGSTQGMGAAKDRSLVPHALSLAFCLAAEDGTGVVVNHHQTDGPQTAA